MINKKIQNFFSGMSGHDEGRGKVTPIFLEKIEGAKKGN